MKKRILSLAMVVILLVSMSVTAFADETEMPEPPPTELTPKEQVRLNEVIGTAYFGNAIRMRRSTDGSMATISKGDPIHYGNYLTHTFDVTTESGTYLGYCAQPSKLPLEGSFAISTLDNDTIKRILSMGPSGGAFDYAVENFWHSETIGITDWDLQYALTHAAAGFVYEGSLKGVEDMENIIRAIVDFADSNWYVAICAKESTLKVAYNDRDNGQDFIWLEAAPLGAVELYKTSANPGITDGNACYSLEGAVYQLLDGGGNVAATLTTDVNGYARAEGITPGNYILKELTAPTGYALDVTEHDVTIASGQTATVNVREIPQSDPVVIMLGKSDAETNANRPQGSSSLAGAEFTVKYYAGIYDSDPAILGHTPLRTWVFRTDADGFIYYSDEWKVSGDDFYYIDNNPDPTIPIGTITIQETKAPAGYLINSEVFVRQITSQGNAEWVNTYNQPTIPEPVIRGGVKIAKWDKELNGNTPQGGGTLAGAQIAIINDNENPVLVNGTSYAKGQTVYTGTTNDHGIMETPADLLPYGYYIYREVKAPAGYQLLGDLEGRFAITEHGKIVDLSTTNPVKDPPIRGGVKLAKWDKELNGNTPQGGGTLSGAQIAIINDNDNPVLVNGTSYAKGQTVYTGTTNAQGIMETSADLLPYGYYIYREVKAPAGYQLQGDLEGSFTITEQGKILDLAMTNPVKDPPIRGGVKLAKWDKELNGNTPQGNGTLSGAQIAIINDSDNPVLVNGTSYAKGQTVYTGTTNARGEIETAADLLPYGRYKYREVKAPAGYQLLGDLEGSFTITEQGIIVDLSTTNPVKDPPIRGGVKLAKWDKELDAKNPQGNATLAGAQIAIINDSNHPVMVKGKSYDKGQTVYTGTTNDKGIMETAADLLPYGRYKYKEIKSPPGYLLSGTLEGSFTITEHGKIVDLTTLSPIKDDPIRGGVKLAKWDKELDAKNPQGNATLAGAQIAIISDNDNPVLVNGKSYNKGQTVYTGTTNDKGIMETVADLLPYGRYKYKEIKSPPGYLLSGTLEGSFTITEQGEIVDLTTLSPIKDDPIRGGVRIPKWDLESDARKPQGGATLEGAVIEITTTSTHPVLVEGVLYQKGEAVATITTNEEGLAETAADLLPYGTYSYQEIQPPPGYLSKGVLSGDFAITQHGVIVDLDDTGHALKNQVIRGDLELIKVSDGDMKRMADVPFQLTNTGTGESHILVTDENGYLSTSSEWNLHSHNTNQGATALDGVWFGEPEALDDDKGALPYGIYLIEELPCEANENKVLLEPFEVSIYRNNVAVKLGTITNDYAPKPEITTMARDAESGNRLGISDTDATIIDTVEYRNLTPGREYTLKGILIDRETKSPLLIDGEKVIREMTFTPKEPVGSVELAFSFDGTSLGKKQVVVFERLYLGDREAAAHTEIFDMYQTVSYEPVEIKTTAIDKETGTKEAAADADVTIIDRVEYKNLTPGQEYTLKGILMDKETGESLKIDGKEVTAERTFIPETADGHVDMEFAFDGRELKGSILVVFETLYLGERQAAAHANIHAASQTVSLEGILITTNAADQETGTHEASADSDVTIIDRVDYINLTPGKEYTVKGILMEKETGEPLTIDGQEVTAERTFTPKEPDGSVELEFTFDGRGLGGRSVVAFERLYEEDVELAVHTDIEDEAQTVDLKEITLSTTAVDKETGTKEASADSSVAITDRVDYTGLTPGKEYTLKGILMDKETGKPLKIDGKEVTAEQTFTPKEPEGYVELEFTFDGRGLGGRSVVVFERLYEEDVELAVHTDIEDEAQTVDLKEITLDTTAVDKETGTKEASADSTVTITDRVDYTGLTPGKEYTLKGILMDKSTGEPLKINGKEVTAEKTFTPKEPEGYVELEFTFDGRGLGGRSVVAFERLYEEDVELAVHTDIEDEAQTVDLKEITLSTTAVDQETGGKEAAADADVTITDRVDYTGLTPGKEYTLKGILMDKAAGEPLKISGKEVTAERTFTPEEPEGYVELEFTFDGRGLGGRSVVVFERLYEEDVELAAHTDIEDEAQTVDLKEITLDTTAVESESGGHEAEAREEITITDRVDYTGLTPGKEYTVKGVLMDKSTGKPLTIDGKEVRAEQTFIPEEADGYVELDFTFNASGLGGRSIVAFETLYEEDVELAVHADIEDADQTVDILPPEPSETPEEPAPPAKPKTPKTGDSSAAMAWMAVLALSVCGAGLFAYKRKRR